MRKDCQTRDVIKQCPITGIIVKHLRTTPKVTTFLPPTPGAQNSKLYLRKKGAVMFVLAALVCGQRSEQFDVKIFNPSIQQPTEFVTKPEVTLPQSNYALPSTQPPRSALEFILGPKSARSGELYHASPDEIYDRILARLIQSEAHETDLHLRGDYRQAFICLSLARKGNTEPFLVSSYQIYGLHPDKVWPSIVANRKARLGREYYDFFDHSDRPRPDVPKKPTLPAPTTPESQIAGDGADRDPHMSAPILKKEIV